MNTVETFFAEGLAGNNVVGSLFKDKGDGSVQYFRVVAYNTSSGTGATTCSSGASARKRSLHQSDTMTADTKINPQDGFTTEQLDFLKNLDGALVAEWFKNSGLTFLGIEFLGIDGEVQEEDHSSSGLSGGAIAGIVIGCVFGVLIIVAIVVFIIVRKKRSNVQPRPAQPQPPPETAPTDA